MELKPLQAQLNAYNMQKAHQKVLLDRMHVFGKLFSFARENHRFDQGVDMFLVDICEQQFRHWLQQLQMQTNQHMAPASLPASGPAPAPRPAAVPAEHVRPTPVDAAPPAPIATPAPAHFEVVNLVEVELRQELAAAKRELEETRQKTVECEATIAKLERKEKEWKAKYLELASKQFELSSQPSEPQPMGTESSCTTPTAAITPVPAVTATSEILHEPQSDDADHILWQGSAVPQWCEGEVASLEARARPSQEYALASAKDVEQWPTQLLVKGVCSSQHASASIAQVIRMGYRVPRLAFTPAGRAVQHLVRLHQDLQAHAKMGVADCIPNMTVLIQPDSDDERQLFAYLLPSIPLKQAVPPSQGNSSGEDQGRKRNRESGREQTRTATTKKKKKSHEEEVADDEEESRSRRRQEKRKKESSDDDFEYHHEEDEDYVGNEDEVDEFEPKEEKKGKRKTRRIR